MNGNQLWIWLVVGLVPYYGALCKAKGGQKFILQALFWSLEVYRQHNGFRQWTVHIPLIQREKK